MPAAVTIGVIPAGRRQRNPREASGRCNATRAQRKCASQALTSTVTTHVQGTPPGSAAASSRQQAPTLPGPADPGWRPRQQMSSAARGLRRAAAPWWPGPQPLGSGRLAGPGQRLECGRPGPEQKGSWHGAMERHVACLLQPGNPQRALRTGNQLNRNPAVLSTHLHDARHVIGKLKAAQPRRGRGGGCPCAAGRGQHRQALGSSGILQLLRHCKGEWRVCSRAAKSDHGLRQEAKSSNGTCALNCVAQLARTPRGGQIRCIPSSGTLGSLTLVQLLSQLDAG